MYSKLSAAGLDFSQGPSGNALDSLLTNGDIMQFFKKYYFAISNNLEFSLTKLAFQNPSHGCRIFQGLEQVS